MALAYFDCFSGVAGDMIIGALLDAGLPFADFKSEIDKLKLSGYEISARKMVKGGIEGTKFSVEVHEKQPTRHPKEITKIILASKLDSDIKEKAVKIFNRLAEAESIAHGEPLEKVHFHEVGAIDAIIDICGAVIGMKLMGINRVYSSLLPLGKGTVTTSHGAMPIPAPATAALVKGFPIKISNSDTELTTPTGAAILTTLATFSDPGEFTIRRAGYGAGSKFLGGLPNLLRVMIGEPLAAFDADTVTLLESNLDRVSSENLGALLDELMASGALDVFAVPIVMKKNRPAHLLSVLCEPDKKDKLAKIIFGSGRTLGIRTSLSSRIKLPRLQIIVSTSGGDVSVKVAKLDGKNLIFPEFDDISRAMKKAGLSYDDIYFEIQRAIRKD
ncbi:MAG TPA: nickel pincer cofactor biosynthesis protein LarC [candidate division Zixibacteria bacterium]|nr:nickel pincer cofactor biosynthesis protein LarC [candidate division Zixibacteria bacterium]